MKSLFSSVGGFVYLELECCVVLSENVYCAARRYCLCFVNIVNSSILENLVTVAALKSFIITRYDLVLWGTQVQIYLKLEKEFCARIGTLGETAYIS